MMGSYVDPRLFLDWDSLGLILALSSSTSGDRRSPKRNSLAFPLQ